MPGWMRYGAYPAPYQAPDPEAEKEALKQQADALQGELETIKKRLSEIEGEKA
jgi:predicted nuclease with TOPRIM domain